MDIPVKVPNTGCAYIHPHCSNLQPATKDTVTEHLRVKFSLTHGSDTDCSKAQSSFKFLLKSRYYICMLCGSSSASFHNYNSGEGEEGEGGGGGGAMVNASVRFSCTQLFIHLTVCHILT